MFHGLKMRAAFITSMARKNMRDCLRCLEIRPTSLQCFILPARYLFIIWLAHYLYPVLLQSETSAGKVLSRGALFAHAVLAPDSCIRSVLNRKSDEVLLRDSISITPRKCYGLPVYISVSEKRSTPSGKRDA